MQAFLEGTRVLDLTQLLPGPYATTMLADLGAEVIKVERPGVGDPVRSRDPSVGDRSYTLLTRNRNKKSIAIDLKHDDGREAFLELARTADVVVESFRPGVVDRLGIGYDDVRKVNEDIVYCSITGYGQDGPYVSRSGHDLNYIGVAGLLGLTGESDGQPAGVSDRGFLRGDVRSVRDLDGTRGRARRCWWGSHRREYDRCSGFVLDGLSRSVRWRGDGSSSW